MDLLTTYAHDPELYAITAPPLISTIDKSSQHPLSLFQPAVSSPAVSWQRFLTVETFQLQAFRFYLHSLPCRTVNWTHCSNCPGYNFSARTTKKHRSSIVKFVSIAAGTCLPSCFPETGWVTPFIKNLLSYQQALLLDPYPATGQHATILWSSRYAVPSSLFDVINPIGILFPAPSTYISYFRVPS
jgi:hypothetical protein